MKMMKMRNILDNKDIVDIKMTKRLNHSEYQVQIRRNLLRAHQHKNHHSNHHLSNHHQSNRHLSNHRSTSHLSNNHLLNNHQDNHQDNHKNNSQKDDPCNRLSFNHKICNNNSINSLHCLCYQIYNMSSCNCH